MEDWGAIILALPFVSLLLASGFWASRRFAGFEHLPGHFDVRGHVTRLAPRSVMVWMLPVTFSVMLLIISGAMVALPREVQNGEPTTGILIVGITLLAAQGLVLWLTDRWARKQG